jgi:hypothetical protein
MDRKNYEEHDPGYISARKDLSVKHKAKKRRDWIRLLQTGEMPPCSAAARY